jgi:hypothetical protein
MTHIQAARVALMAPPEANITEIWDSDEEERIIMSMLLPGGVDVTVQFSYDGQPILRKEEVAR